jgi:uncharacterized protein (TIRG00374 family)
MLILAVIGGFLLVGFLSVTVVLIFFSVLLAFLAISVFVFHEKISRRFFRTIFNVLLPEKVKGGVRNTSRAFYDNMPAKKTLVVPFVITVLSWLTVYSSMYLIAASLGLRIPYILFVTSMPIATVVGLIPITVSGWGTREAALIALLSPFTDQTGSVLTMSVISFFLLSVIPAFFGGWFSVRETVSGKEKT